MDTQEITDKAIEYMLPRLEALVAEGDSRLSEYEIRFIPSVAAQWKRVHKMSEKQREILGKIWDKV